MNKKTLTAFAAVGIASAIAIPTIALGNARRDTGSLSYLRTAQTPYLSRLTGANEPAPGGDTDGVGAAAITFDVTDPLDAATGAEACWDLTYTGITTPTSITLNAGAAGATGALVIDMSAGLGATSAKGCASFEPVTEAAIVATPADYYVNIVTAGFAGGALRGQLAAGPAPAGEIHMLPVPLRAYDSRDNNGVKINPGETRTISLTSGRDLNGTSMMALPPGATAALLTLTVAETGGVGGFLTVYSAAASQPATSTINWKAAGQDIATNTQVFVDATGSIKVTDGLNGGPTQFVIDVIGYLY